MRSLALTFALLLSCVVNSGATLIDTFTPSTPVLFTINFGPVTLQDLTQLPAFTFQFTFNYALPQSNYPNLITFKTDNSELNPNTSSLFSPSPITVVSAPTLTATNPADPGEATWTFDAANSYLKLSSTSVEIGVQYDPPMFDVIFVIDPFDDLVFTLTPENTTVTDQNNNKKSDNSTTLKETVQPEPGTLGMLLTGLAIFAARVRRGARS